MKNKNNLIYPNIDPEDYVKHYEVHIDAMTLESLHDKSQIAAQLAWRDARIEELAILLDQKTRECQEAQSLLPPFLGGSSESLRKVYVCRSCECLYGDSPVSSCDCFPDKNEFDSGVLLLDKKNTA